MIDYLLYKVGLVLTAVLPRPAVYGLAAALAECSFLARAPARQAVLSNLTRVVGESWSAPRMRRVARRSFRNFSYNVVDFLRIPALGAADVEARCTVEGWEHMERAHAIGKGVVLLSAHFGGWELGGVLVSLRGLPVNAVALDHRSPRVTRLFAGHRRSKGIRTLPVRGSIFAIMKALRRGEVVAIMGDRDVAHQGRAARFFGETTVLPRAHASIAVKTGAPIVPGFVERLPAGRFRMRILPPVEVGDLPEQGRVERLVERCLTILETQIRARPEQWCVFEPLWPGGATAGVTAHHEDPPRRVAESRRW